MIINPQTWLAHVEQLAPPLTGWFPGDVSPCRVGYYDRYYTDGMYRHYWDGAHWRANANASRHWRQVGDYPSWRGIATPSAPSVTGGEVSRG